MVPGLLRTLVGEVDLEHLPVDEEPQDHAKDAERVCEAVRDDRTRGIRRRDVGRQGARQRLDRLDRRGQRRGVRERAAEEPGNCGDRECQQLPERDGEDRPEREEGGGDGVDPQAAFLERSEESSSRLQPDGVDEQDEADDVDELRESEALVERPEEDPDEEHGHDPELKAGDADVADQVAQADDDEEEEQLVLRQQCHERAHRFPLGRRGALPPRTKPNCGTS